MYRGSYTYIYIDICALIYIYIYIYIYIPYFYKHTHTYMVAAVAQWLRRCATNREVAGMMPGVVIGIS